MKCPPRCATTRGANNLHAYTRHWHPEAWLAWEDTWDRRQDPYEDDHFRPFPLVRDPLVFEEELPYFVGYHRSNHHRPPQPPWEEPFLRDVAHPLLQAFHVRKTPAEALHWVEKVAAADWRIAATNWLSRRLDKKGVTGGRTDA